MSVQKRILLIALGFAAGFGAVLATRLDASAIAAVLGAVCALAFGVPITMLVTAMLFRYRQQAQQPQPRSMPQFQSPVVIVPPAQMSQLGYTPPWYNPAELETRPTGPRRFSVIGEADEDWSND